MILDHPEKLFLLIVFIKVVNLLQELNLELDPVIVIWQSFHLKVKIRLWTVDLELVEVVFVQFSKGAIGLAFDCCRPVAKRKNEWHLSKEVTLFKLGFLLCSFFHMIDNNDGTCTLGDKVHVHRLHSLLHYVFFWHRQL